MGTMNCRAMLLAFLIICASTVASSRFAKRDSPMPAKCNLPRELIDEIGTYAPIVRLIKSTVVNENGPLKNSTWTELEKFVDDFGYRQAGTQNLENSIDYMLDKLRSAKLDNVHGENASVPHWIRGKESATLMAPRMKNLAILGLGGSVGTPPSGITADVIVVRSFDELDMKRKEIPGKIVVFNQEFISYPKTSIYRTNGSSRAAEYGAVAALIRSVTPFSLYSPHTGQLIYYENVKHIPAACITIEDAELLHRLYNGGKQLKIQLKMEAHEEQPVVSRNVVAEIVGKTEPKKVVIVSGHIDSWDVGQGAMDDGGGAFISWKSLEVLRYLRLTPRRTIRAVLWTAEEEGYIGAKSYFDNHINETDNFTAVMESDEGTFTPTGLQFYGTEPAACIMEEILKLFEPFNATILERSKDPVGSDIELWQKVGVPGISLGNKNDKYFWYHHTEADTMTVEDPSDLDLGTAVFSAASYIIADLSEDLPRPKKIVFM